VIEGAQADGLDGVVAAGVGGQHDAGDGGDGRGALQEDQAIFVGHAQVDDGGIDRMCCQQGQAGSGAAGFQHLVAEVADGLGQAATKGSIVIDDQDARHGNSISKRAPRSLAAR
jgi:hypothetical protein